ncbi:MAG: hypothetical protein M0R03_13995 [Novosphingobium sp.]|nr:hypothetical protein [Novosphingobium sp.]
MAGDQVELKLARIEQALSRIERATERARAERQSLESRDARLRQAVSGTLEELDRLIAEHSS